MIKRLDLYLNTPTMGVVQAADVALVEEGSALRQVAFRYRPDYLAQAEAFAIDPEQLPLGVQEKVFDCRAGAPAFSATTFGSMPAARRRDDRTAP